MVSHFRCARIVKCLLLPTLLFVVVLCFVSSVRNSVTPRDEVSEALPQHLTQGYVEEQWDRAGHLREKLLDRRVDSKFVAVRDYLKASRTYSGNSSVTLTTQGTYEFLHHVEELCIRWRAPVSVAVYAPGGDFVPAVERMLYLRHCRHPCLKINVTWHVIFDKLHALAEDTLLEAREGSSDCQRVPNSTSSYRQEHGLTYPINVARNVARKAARTHYVLASDIELYPSLDIVPKFLDMVSKEEGAAFPRVYVLPVFEVEKNCQVPGTKKQLLQLFYKKKAVFFHRSVCDPCHRFPNRNLWLKIFPPNDTLNVFSITKRYYPWEPFYIGTRNEPIFDERFTWEGKMNKMPQVLAMCFLDYDFYVLDNAYLVHSPGIKKVNGTSERRRAKYVAANRRAYNSLRRDLIKRYGQKRKCR
ncbi:beta-1,4-glucuronyltransferase 1-like [Centruroides sculpturatus]|uniref:beta-1,4-glucuronyltransferase 1-like n=1 Tax=Centruroides sculpturatus TaxID=218467 RepID=UPI000C6EF90F|nr:beta-1,4-glucuronyltransferase 1-like [Centruroides sculpturatus]